MTGRKPLPPALVDREVFKKNGQEYEAREESYKKLQVSKVLKCPSHLTPEAKKEWKRIMKLYNQMDADILSDLDLQPLIMYCEAVSVYKQALETRKEFKRLVSTNEEMQKLIDNTLKTMERQSKIISSLSEQLCLTPVGRARMGMNATAQKEEEDPFIAIMNRGKEAKS
jgi:P27 family predicted phage terminase small subunit